MSPRVAAFFDLDGTLLPPPSLEQRFFRMLRDRREIPLTNYFVWWREALKLLPHGINRVMQANKMYLRGVHSFVEIGAENRINSSAHKNGHPSQLRASEEDGRPSKPPRFNPRWPVPHFFEDGMERVAWHAMQGHAIVIVSGTPEPLANAAARALETELATRGIASRIRACATKLEERDGHWTGRILGEAKFGKAKARAISTLAEEMNLDLSQSWAYGDSAQDRWMLASVGNPAAVNPTPKLSRIAWKRDWPLLRTTNRLQQIQETLQHAERCA
ncbi:MAG TPA: HAD-IB family phosphatase [Candidatus Acidoferrum sp.]|nr:HAD-IB family phosphatase [Candidatus Acidoferrum sp.]